MTEQAKQGAAHNEHQHRPNTGYPYSTLHYRRSCQRELAEAARKLHLARAEQQDLADQIAAAERIHADDNAVVLHHLREVYWRCCARRRAAEQAHSAAQARAQEAGPWQP